MKDIDWSTWSPSSQERLLDTLREAEAADWRPFYCPRPRCDGNHHIISENLLCADGLSHKWDTPDDGVTWACELCEEPGHPEDLWLFRHARADQRPPPTKLDWLAWLMLAGRGAGKTRGGSEWVHRLAATPGIRIALIAPTSPDVRDTMVEGESGILNTAKPGTVPSWEPSKKRLTWPNGATAFGYSGEEPDRLRGKQHHFAWVDEPAHIPLIEEVWYNLLFGLRLGTSPRVCLTTSPLPSKWLTDLIAEPTTIVTRASTYSNLRNLPQHHATVILKRYEGTRLGRQEIDGEILSDVEGALWKVHMITDHALDELPLGGLDRIVVAVDPAGTAGKRSDETGIVVVGVKGEHFYVLEDASGKYSPAEWAGRALELVEQWKADALVVEKTYGRDMVTLTINSVIEKRRGITPPRIIPVDSRRGKALRAEPVVAFYEKERVHHVGTQLETLEDQMTGWVPGKGDSPDRVDALVHGITELAKIVAPAEIGDRSKLLSAPARLNRFPHLRRRSA